MIPFKTQYDKIVGAYMRNELHPFKSCACFIGNLLNQQGAWIQLRDGSDNAQTPFKVRSPLLIDFEDNQYERGLNCLKAQCDNFYTPQQIVDMEYNFLHIYNKGLNEESLFLAMESTLLMLREIHESKGEVIEPYTFTKRVLV